MKGYLFVMVCAALGGAIVKAQSPSADSGLDSMIMRRKGSPVPYRISLSEEDTIIATPFSAIRVKKADFYSGKYLSPDRGEELQPGEGGIQHPEMRRGSLRRPYHKNTSSSP